MILLMAEVVFSSSTARLFDMASNLFWFALENPSQTVHFSIKVRQGAGRCLNREFTHPVECFIHPLEPHLRNVQKTFGIHDVSSPLADAPHLGIQLCADRKPHWIVTCPVDGKSGTELFHRFLSTLSNSSQMVPIEQTPTYPHVPTPASILCFLKISLHLHERDPRQSYHSMDIKEKLYLLTLFVNYFTFY